jgi:hypothetical protein
MFLTLAILVSAKAEVVGNGVIGVNSNNIEDLDPMLISANTGIEVNASAIAVVNVDSVKYLDSDEEVTIEVRADNSKRAEIRKGNVSAQTSLEISEVRDKNGTKLEVKFSNGNSSEVKIMPATASARAIEALSLHACSIENNCTIELKEVGKGNQTKLAYMVTAEKEVKLFGFMKVKMKVSSDVDAQTGTVVSSNKPWWAFMAKESTI